MMQALELVGLALTLPGAIVAASELIQRRAAARSATRPRVIEIDFSVRVKIRRRP